MRGGSVERASDADGLRADAAASWHAAAASRPSLVGGLVRSARPRQWIKNLLVFAAPAAAGALTNPVALGRSAIALVAFTLAASGAYLVNDASDVEEDRRHPDKRHRPIAAGVVPVRLALAVGLGLMLAAVAVALALSGLALAGVVVLYLAVTGGYSGWLREVSVLDICAVAAGFILRTIAGGVATGLPLSDWFLLVVSFGALFIAAGKRFAEVRELGSSAVRATLAEYTIPFLRNVTFASATIAILAYCAWAITRVPGSVWLVVSILPLVMGLLRYALLLEHGHGQAPEDVLLSDRAIQGLVVLWGATVGLGIYLVPNGVYGP